MILWKMPVFGIYFLFSWHPLPFPLTCKYICLGKKALSQMLMHNIFMASEEWHQLIPAEEPSLGRLCLMKSFHVSDLFHIQNKKSFFLKKQRFLYLWSGPRQLEPEWVTHCGAPHCHPSWLLWPCKTHNFWRIYCGGNALTVHWE